MNSTHRAVLAVRSTADLLAAVPYLLGFHPADSVVVVALRNNRVAFVARGDLPGVATTATSTEIARPNDVVESGHAVGPKDAVESGHAVGPNDAVESGYFVGPAGAVDAADAVDVVGSEGAVVELGRAAEHLAAVVARQGVDRTTIIGYGPPAQVTPMVEAVTGALGRVGLPVLDAIRVTGDRYWSYACTGAGCCPAEGTPFDTSTSQLAATATFAGQVALPDRDALVRQIAPIDGPARQAMREATRKAESRLNTLLDRAPPKDPLGRRALRRAGRTAVRKALHRHRTGGQLTDDEVAWLCLLLVHLPVRDDAWQQTDGEDWHLALWTDVLRRAEPDLVPAPATLLAFAAWRAGQGALAGVAVERALEARPDYSFAQLLAEALQAGIGPSALDGWPESFTA